MRCAHGVQPDVISLNGCLGACALAVQWQQCLALLGSMSAQDTRKKTKGSKECCFCCVFFVFEINFYSAVTARKGPVLV